MRERLVTLAGAKRVLFLVDRANLGRQTLKEFQGFEVSGAGREFTELYNVQRLEHVGIAGAQDDVRRAEDRLGQGGTGRSAQLGEARDPTWD